MHRLYQLAGVGLATMLALGLDPALAQEDVEAMPEAAEAAPPISLEGQYVFNTLLFLVGGFLVMWMAAGFTMLEAGMVRAKNVSMQCMKNIGLYSVAGIMYWFIGYNLMYSGVDGGFFGTPVPASFPEPGAAALDPDANYAPASDWFFQMVFCATTASIVSGTLAERIKLWPFLLFTAALTGIIYPITGAWQWGGGWLAELGFADFAGSTLVHSVGGWAALTGALLLGARAGKYGPGGVVNVMPGSSIPLATLGTFILWLGWFGFNGGSQLALGTVSDAADVARIFVNTNLAAAAGVASLATVSPLPRLRLAPGAAKKRVDTARQLTEGLGETGEALAEGDINLEQAAAIAQAARQVERAARNAAADSAGDNPTPGDDATAAENTSGCRSRASADT